MMSWIDRKLRKPLNYMIFQHKINSQPIIFLHENKVIIQKKLTVRKLLLKLWTLYWDGVQTGIIEKKVGSILKRGQMLSQLLEQYSCTKSTRKKPYFLVLEEVKQWSILKFWNNTIPVLLSISSQPYIHIGLLSKLMLLEAKKPIGHKLVYKICINACSKFLYIVTEWIFRLDGVILELNAQMSEMGMTCQRTFGINFLPKSNKSGVIWNKYAC